MKKLVVVWLVSLLAVACISVEGCDGIDADDVAAPEAADPAS